MTRIQHWQRETKECKKCGRPARGKYCNACRKLHTTTRQRKAPPAQMSHASSGKARKKARHGEAKLRRAQV
jgi:hypothetical protein